MAHDGDYRWTRASLDPLFAGFGRLGGVFRGLLFEGDDFGLSAEEARHLTGEFGVEGLVDGGKYSADERRAIRSLARRPSFSARSFTEIPSVMVMLRVIGNGSLLIDTRGGGV